MPDPYMTAGLIHAALALLIIRKYVIYCRRRDEGELAIPILICSAIGLPLVVIIWPGVWFLVGICWITGLVTIPEAINKFRHLRKELG